MLVVHRSNGRRAFIEEEMAERAPKWRGPPPHFCLLSV
jgi:hypothetical protein